MEKIAHLVHNFHNISRGNLQFHLAILNAAHFKDIIDKGKKMFAGRLDFP